MRPCSDGARRGRRTLIGRVLVVGTLAAALILTPALVTDQGAPEPADRAALSIDTWGEADDDGWWYSEVLDADDAVLLGASWDGVAVVEVRKGDGDEWARWMPFLAIADHAPESDEHGGHDHGGHDHEHDDHDRPFEASPSDGRDHHDPIWVGSSDHLQLRVRADDPPTVELDVVTMRPEEMTAFAPRSPQGGTAIASDGPPEIIPRAAWDPAGECRPREREPGDAVEMAHVHHTVMFPDYAPDEADDVVRALCLFHVEAREFRDLGYHFLIDRYGRIYEGRDGSLRGMVEGGHAAGFNRVSLGVSLMGDFETNEVPDAALDALERFLAWAFTEHGIDPNGSVTVESTGGELEGLTRFEEGEVVELPTIVGHRDTGSATLCPGRYLYAAMGGIGSRVEARMEDAAESGEPHVTVPELPEPSETEGAAGDEAVADESPAEDEGSSASGPDASDADADPGVPMAAAPELTAGVTTAGLQGSAMFLLVLVVAALTFEWRLRRR